VLKFKRKFRRVFHEKQYAHVCRFLSSNISLKSNLVCQQYQLVIFSEVLKKCGQSIANGQQTFYYLNRLVTTKPFSGFALKKLDLAYEPVRIRSPDNALCAKVRE
jgi:hypothetical protein